MNSKELDIRLAEIQKELAEVEEDLKVGEKYHSQFLFWYFLISFILLVYILV